MAPSVSRAPDDSPAWFRGDLHAHTSYSDGYYSPAELVEVARAEGLDFLAITDHNSIGAFSDLGAPPDVLIVPGVEVSLVEGHFNVLGVDGRADWMQLFGTHQYRASLTGRFNTTTALMRQIRAEGLLNSINHPLLHPWEWRDGGTALEHLDCLEIWNDPTWPDNVRANPQAVAFWTATLNAGYRITAVGGSDYHHPAPLPSQDKAPERLGVPSTYVLADELSVPALVAALRARRAYVSVGPRVAFRACVGGAAYDIGANLDSTDGEVEFLIEVWESPVPARAVILRNGAPVAEAPVDGQAASLRHRESLDSQRPAWYRLDVLDQDGQMLAITNPIFTGPWTQPAQLTFGDFIAF